MRGDTTRKEIALVFTGDEFVDGEKIIRATLSQHKVKGSFFVPLFCMKKQTIDKKQVLKSVAKTVTDKEVVRSYIKGKTSIQTVTKKGIKFAKPL